jgi:predicted helicase
MPSGKQLMKKSWSQITPKQFEKLCYLILKADKFTDIQWYGKSGGDKGRDLTAKKEESHFSTSKRIAKWVIQCKRYVTKPPTKRDIESFLTDAREHRPDSVLIMLTNTLTPDTREWLDSVRQNYNFRIELVEEIDLEEAVDLYKSQISERLPKVLSQTEPVIAEEVIKKKQYVFSIRGVDQIEVVAFDKPSLKKAREDVIEFINFLKENEIDYGWQQEKKRRPRKRSS